jgi:tight adherence protein C
MAANVLIQYPELPLAVLLGLGLLRDEQSRKAFHFPHWLSEPAQACLSIMPQRYLAWSRQALVHANRRDSRSFGDFASFKLYLMLLSLVLSAILPFHFVAVIAMALWTVPDLFLWICVITRRQVIKDSLPQALDLMILCVDAGLGLDATLQRLTTDNTVIASALNDEFKILAGELLLGLDRERAYEALFTRTGVDELRTLGSALSQANKLGLSVAKILRAQSEFSRKKQSQRAEERALKIPVYMAFPLWFFIMPSLMLLVLGPSLLNFYHQLAPGMGAQ